MKNSHGFLFVGALLTSMIFSTGALADPIVFNNLSPTDIQDFGGISQWTSEALSLPGGTMIGPSSTVDIVLNLSGDVTTDSIGDFGAGVVVSPTVAPGDEIFGFTLQLLENGSDVGAPVGFDLNNPFDFDVNNVSTGDPSGGFPTGVTFNSIDVTLYNTTQLETVTSFQAFVGSPVPDGFSTLELLSLGLLAMGGFAIRKSPALSRG